MSIFDIFKKKSISPDKIVKPETPASPTKEKEEAKAPAKKEEKEKKITASGRPLDIPFGTRIDNISKDGIEFYWKKLENTDGYEIYRGYSENGPFELIATYNSRRVGTHVDPDFDHSKKAVYYTVRTFLKNDDDSVEYSDLIPAKKAEFKKVPEAERETTYMYSGTVRNLRVVYGWGEPSNVSWKSSDESVATVDNNGDVTAIARGKCVLTCTDNDTNLSATATIVVDREACEPLSEIKSRFSFNESTKIWENPSSDKKNDAVIMMVGDLMCGSAQMKKQYNDEIGWCFNDSFEYVKNVFKSADLSVANLETLLASGWPYMTDEVYINNQNNCNAPSRYLDAVKYANFDMVSMSNNHNCDGGVRALLETVEQVDKYKIIRTGAFLTSDEDRYVVIDVNGIKVGFVAYNTPATGFNRKERSWSEEERNTHLNIFSLKTAKKDIEACRKAGAEYIIAYMHWGMKNFKNKTPKQVEDALKIANAGADYIVGANPHVLQEYDIIKADDGREVPCFYSTGNFQSIMNQIPENRDSVIVRIRLTKDENGIKLVENGYHPCHTFKNCRGNNWTPMVLQGEFGTNFKNKYKQDFIKRIKETIGDQVSAL